MNIIIKKIGERKLSWKPVDNMPLAQSEKEMINDIVKQLQTEWATDILKHGEKMMLEIISE